jgi:hypothetical protein
MVKLYKQEFSLTRNNILVFSQPGSGSKRLVRALSGFYGIPYRAPTNLMYDEKGQNKYNSPLSVLGVAENGFSLSSYFNIARIQCCVMSHSTVTLDVINVMRFNNSRPIVVIRDVEDSIISIANKFYNGSSVSVQRKIEDNSTELLDLIISNWANYLFIFQKSWTSEGLPLDPIILSFEKTVNSLSKSIEIIDDEYNKFIKNKISIRDVIVKIEKNDSNLSNITSKKHFFKESLSCQQNNIINNIRGCCRIIGSTDDPLRLTH